VPEAQLGTWQGDKLKQPQRNSQILYDWNRQTYASIAG